MMIAILALAAVLCFVFGLVAYKIVKENDNSNKLGYSATFEEFLESIKGKDGTNGTDGKDGADSVGVKNAFINEKGDLIIELTYESTVNCGNISSYCENLQYSVIKEDNNFVGYSVTDIDLIIPSTYRGRPVKTIEASAFSQCNNLTSVVIPDGVTSIGDSAFDGCSGLTRVYYKGTAEDWVNIFIGTSNEILTNATRYYYSETAPGLNADGTDYDGNYWYSVEGLPVILVKTED